MFRRTVAPGRFRRRLTVAFVIVAGVSALTLALGSYLLVRQARLDESLDRAATDLRYQLVLAEQFLPLDPERSANLLGSFERSGRHVVLRDDGRSAASNPAFDPVLPTVLRSSVAAGRLADPRLDVDGRHLLVVGARIRASAAELYVVYLEDAIHDDLARLGTTLLGGWGVVVVLAAGVGWLLARRTLEPVGRASAAARAVAEGLLATRLPVEGADEFGVWASSFNRMAAALETKIAALSEAQARERRFTADVAHELRTPVTALLAAASLLREDLWRLPEEVRRPAYLLGQPPQVLPQQRRRRQQRRDRRTQLVRHVGGEPALAGLRLGQRRNLRLQRRRHAVERRGPHPELVGALDRQPSGQQPLGDRTGSRARPTHRLERAPGQQPSHPGGEHHDDAPAAEQRRAQPGEVVVDGVLQVDHVQFSGRGPDPGAHDEQVPTVHVQPLVRKPAGGHRRAQDGRQYRVESRIRGRTAAVVAQHHVTTAALEATQQVRAALGIQRQELLGEHQLVAQVGRGAVQRLVQPRLAHQQVRPEGEGQRRDAGDDDEGDGQPAAETPGGNCPAKHAGLSPGRACSRRREPS